MSSGWKNTVIATLILAIIGLSYCEYLQLQRFEKHGHIYVSHKPDEQKLIAYFHQVVDPLSQDPWLEQFVLDFPYMDYHIYQVPHLGSFYVDETTDLIKNFVIKGKTFEAHNVELIRKYAKKGSTVLDVGAHIGTMTFPMSQTVGSSGRVIAFEPQPKTFRELMMNVWRNKADNIRLVWAAVGAKEGSIELSPIVAGNEGGTTLGGGGTGKFVSLLTIDSMHLKNVSLIKIDVEGMEDEVLDGAKETILQNWPVLVIEICGGSDFDTASEPIRAQILHTVQKMENWGYSVKKICGHDYLALPQ